MTLPVNMPNVPWQFTEREAISLQLVEHSADAMVVINRQGEIALLNRQAELTFGYTREEIMGKKLEMLIPEGNREVHISHRETYVRDPHVREMGIGKSLRGVCKTGEEFDVRIKIAPVIVPGAGIYYLAIVRSAKEEKI